MPEITFQGDVMLAGWSETHNGGAKVTFWLRAPEDLDVFRGLTVAKGKVAGQRLAMVLVEIDDDEQPKESAPKKFEPPVGPLCMLAVRWCQSPQFRRWCWEGYVGGDPELGDTTEIGARRLILDECAIASRKELDTNAEAAAVFNDKFREPFMAWLKENNLTVE